MRGLNADGVPSPGGGAEWQQWAVSRTVSNPVHVGWLRRGSGSAIALNDAGDPVVVVEGPTTVTVEDWERARAVIDSHSKPDRFRDGRGGVKTPTSLLSGLLRCGRCGRSMRSMGASTHPHANYRCQSRSLGGRCKGMTVMARVVDPAVVAAVLDRLRSLDPTDTADLATLNQVLTRLPTTDVIGEVRRRLADRRLRELRVLIADLEEARYVLGDFPGEHGDARYRRLRRLQESKVAMLREVTGATGRGRPQLGPLIELLDTPGTWDTWTIDQQQLLVRAALERVVIDPAPNQAPDGTRPGSTTGGSERERIPWSSMQ